MLNRLGIIIGRIVSSFFCTLDPFDPDNGQGKHKYTYKQNILISRFLCVLHWYIHIYNDHFFFQIKNHLGENNAQMSMIIGIAVTFVVVGGMKKMFDTIF